MAILSFRAGMAIALEVNELVISGLRFATMAIPREKSRMAIGWSIHQMFLRLVLPFRFALVLRKKDDKVRQMYQES